MNKYAEKLLIILMLLACGSAFSQPLTANAGPDKVICPGVSASIGGLPAATGGLSPYTYSWSPNFYLTSTTSANPSSTAPTWVTYTLTVTDDTGAVATDQVVVSQYYITNVNAGNDTSICENSYALLGNDLNISGMGVSYSWFPTTFLDNNTLPRPTCVSPTSSITYTLTASSASCPPLIDEVTVTLIPTPGINAGPDITINEGEVATLQAGGGYYYGWNPLPIMYYTTANPDVEPTETTTYYLFGTDATKTCVAFDSVVVTVIPSEDIVLYNTFTPNADGNNDTFYIGNIQKYPNNHLEIFNRNGKQVYKTNGYHNEWDGHAYGEKLPEGVYFFVLDLGDGKGVRNGTITIID